MLINSTYFTDAEEALFRAFCKEKGRFIAEVARAAIIEYIENHKDDKPEWMKDAEIDLARTFSYKRKE